MNESVIPQPKAKRVYNMSKREQKLFVLVFAFACLLSNLLFEWHYTSPPALGVVAAVAAGYAILLWYLGAASLKKSGTRLLFAAIILLTLTFVLFSDRWLRGRNFLILLLLIGVHVIELCRVSCKPWYLPSMLLERAQLLWRGVFGRLDSLPALRKSVHSTGQKRSLSLLLGAVAAVVLVVCAANLLAQADAVFQAMTREILERFAFDEILPAKLFFGVCATPFLFGLFYFLGRPEAMARKEPALPKLDASAAVLILASLDALYLFFLVVQARGLFGGEAYLQQIGLSYATYARSGFFQLVFVTALNLSVVLVLLQITQRSGGAWRWMRALSMALVVLSVIILCSAAWRMTLYVGAYGLSARRLMTYWGMGMIALFLVLSAVKICKSELSFFRYAAPLAVAGWLLLNYASVDTLVARYNLSHPEVQMDYYYHYDRAYESLFVLDEEHDIVTRKLAQRSRETAQWECEDWEYWCLPAWLWGIP